jgi:hypothetical protein
MVLESIVLNLTSVFLQMLLREYPCEGPLPDMSSSERQAPGLPTVE